MCGSKNGKLYFEVKGVQAREAKNENKRIYIRVHHTCCASLVSRVFILQRFHRKRGATRTAWCRDRRRVKEGVMEGGRTNVVLKCISACRGRGRQAGRQAGRAHNNWLEQAIQTQLERKGELEIKIAAKRRGPSVQSDRPGQAGIFDSLPDPPVDTLSCRLCLGRQSSSSALR